MNANQTHRLELVATGHDIDQAKAVAEALAGTLLCDERDDAAHLPFRALVSAITDDVETLLQAADVGAYVVYRRVIKERTAQSAEDSPGTLPTGRLPGPIALFPMVHHPDLSHRQSDDHWRDRHAPLALEHHPFMSHYTQLSVVHRLHGPEWDGFALCGFDTLEDLRERFFGSPEGKIAIRNDVATFANTSESPRRLIAVETLYREAAPC